MPVDLNDWRHLVEQQIAWLADEGGQQRAWFGVGPETSSPDEDFCQFLDDARAEAFFARSDTGLNTTQIAAGQHLAGLVRRLADETPDHIEPSDLIDDPRWQQIRSAAARTLELLRQTRHAAE